MAAGVGDADGLDRSVPGRRPSTDAVEAAAALGVPEEAVAALRARRCAGAARHPASAEASSFRRSGRCSPPRSSARCGAPPLARGVRLYEGTRATRIADGLVETPARPRARARGRRGDERVDDRLARVGPAADELRQLRRPHRAGTGALAEIGWTGGEAIVDGRMFVHYFRTTADGRVLMGSGSGPIGFGGRVDRRFTHDVPSVGASRAGAARAPARRSAALRVERAWGGPVDVSSDHLPFFGTVPGARIHFGAGYSGNGVGPSWLGGQILASLVLGADDEWSRLPLATRRVPSFPPEPLRRLGGGLIRWGILSVEEAEDSGPPSAARRALRRVASAPPRPARRDALVGDAVRSTHETLGGEVAGRPCPSRTAAPCPAPRCRPGVSSSPPCNTVLQGRSGAQPSASWRNGSRFETPTPTRRSGPGRSWSARSRREHARSPIVSASSMPAGQRRRAAADREVGIAHLRRHRAGALAAAGQVVGDASRHAAELGVEDLRLLDVALERLLLADRDALDGEVERPRVDAACAVAQHQADLAGQEARDLGVLERGELTDRLDAGAREPDLRLRADAGELPHGERRQVRGLAPGRDDRDAAGLACVARHLGDDLAGGDAERARQARRPAHRRLHRIRHAPRGEEIVVRDLVRRRGSPRRCPCARRSARPRARLPRRPASTGGRACAAAGRRRRAGSAGSPRRSSSPSGSRSAAPRSSPSRRRRGRADRRRRRAASRGATAPPAPRRRRRTRPGRGARRSPRQDRQRYRKAPISAPPVTISAAPIHEVPADELGAAEQERREHDADERLDGDERADDRHAPAGERLEEEDVREAPERRPTARTP